MTSDRSWTHRAAMAFYGWLVEKPEGEIPRLPDICLEMPQCEPVDPYRLAQAIEWLRRQKMLEVRRGTRGRARDHLAIRVRSTGRIYSTRDCPFDLPEQTA
jgi:hypothetical protein